jgi:peptidoglycan/LPS O-acetylase OafA/YrhL
MIATNVEVKRFGRHRNAFGFMRLLFASLVIVSHTPEMMDGNRSREILSRLFGTMSFGDLAVDGFFIVSGFLITGSYIKNPIINVFLVKRIARIYPAFILCSVVCVIFVAPLAGASADSIRAYFPIGLYRALILRPPRWDGVITGTTWPALNLAMWTIAFEFECYLLVLFLGVTGLLRRPWLLAIVSIVCIFAYAQSFILEHDHHFRLFGFFIAGAVYFLWRDQIVFTPLRIAMALVGLLILMSDWQLAEPAVAIFGSYLIFAFASLGASWSIASINNRNDISYGVYLYAWPIEKLILWYLPALNPLGVGTATFAGACACGWLSWHGLEKRVIRLSEQWEPPLFLKRKLSTFFG